MLPSRALLLSACFLLAAHAAWAQDPDSPGLVAPLADAARELRGLELSRGPAVAFTAALQGADPTLARQAARALGRLHDPTAPELLLPALSAEDPELRVEAAFAMGHYPDTAPALVVALDTESDPRVRASLLDALGRTGDASVLPALQRAVRGGATAEAVAASHAIGRLGVRGELSPPPAEVVELLLEQLPRLDLERRRAAAFALARTKPSDLPEPLADRLLQGIEQQADPTARAWLVRAACTGLDSGRWERALEHAATDGSQAVRVALARGLATRGDAEASTALAPLLADADRAVRIAALDAAARLAWSDTWEQPLQAMLQLHDVEQQARALPLLAEVGRLAEPEGWLHPTVEGPIRAAMISTVQEAQQLADLAVYDRAVMVRTAAAEQLLTLDPPVDRDLLWPLLEQPDPVVAGLVGLAMAEAPDSELIQRVQQQLVDRNDYHGILAMLEVLAEALEASGVEAGGARPLPLPGSLNAQVAMRVTELQGHEDLGIRNAAVRLGALLGLGTPSLPPFPRLLEPQELQALLGARIRTSRGELVLSFEQDAAPYTVQRWVELAEAGWFDGLTFHRIVPDFVVQGGCPRGDGYGGPSFALPDELSPLPFDAWAVGMATGGPDTAGSQWFITLSPQPHLDGDYTLFAQLEQGRDVLRQLQQGDRVEAVIIERSAEPSTHP
jgi:cyclophilin family peptidyl-prolyl cis-trans isomerase/HEAT repeat protein